MNAEDFLVDQRCEGHIRERLEGYPGECLGDCLRVTACNLGRVSMKEILSTLCTITIARQMFYNSLDC